LTKPKSIEPESLKKIFPRHAPHRVSSAKSPPKRLLQKKSHCTTDGIHTREHQPVGKQVDRPKRLRPMEKTGGQTVRRCEENLTYKPKFFHLLGAKFDRSPASDWSCL
jgi:hypothetical protein